MITQSYKKWLFLPFILLAILYACTSEYDGHADDAEKQIDPLTVATAQSLYEQYVGKASKLKSTSDGFAPEFLPDWSRGQLSSDSNWYVVESPLETSGDIRVRFMIPEVKEYCDLNTIRPPQVLRQVVMRNKQTGLDYAFIMVVMPELDYMLSKGDELDKNHYLTRESDLSGAVIFYTTDGEFVNGWLYENGKITGGIGGSGKQLKGYITKCYSLDFYAVDRVTGEETYRGSANYCQYTFSDIGDLDGGSGWGGADPRNLPSLSVGGGSGSPTAPNVDDKNDEEPSDPCKSMSGKMAATNFTQTITDLKGLTGQKYEAGRAYTYSDGKYAFANHDGNPGEPEITYSPKGFSKIDGFIHSHYDGLLKTFSSSDLMIPYHWFMNKNGINNLNTFSLGLVTSEGTYFLFVSDLAKYMDFGKMFADRKGLDILSHFYKEGYKIDETKSALASMESLIKLLDNLNSGLTLMKDSGNNKFSIVTKDSNGNIKLVNCN